MRKISIYSLIIGVGVGIIITSIFNILWIQLDDNYLQSKNNKYEDANDANTRTIDEIKYSKNDESISVSNDSGKNEGVLELIEDIYNNEINTDYSEVIITKGMTSEEIANLLENKGIIENDQEFHNLVSKFNLARRFQYGVKLIPDNSTLEEIMSILTK